jgi:protein-disulfide isomerase
MKGGKMSDERVTREDHVRGNPQAPVVVIEYADFQCPYCARAHKALTDLRDEYGDKLCLVYRHLPLSDLHPFAGFAAEAAEAAGVQGKFWEMHDALFEYQALVDPDELPSLASGVGLDVSDFRDDMVSRRFRERVEGDAERARSEGASGTPAFFINGERYQGDSDHEALAGAIRAACGGADSRA